MFKDDRDGAAGEFQPFSTVFGYRPLLCWTRLHDRLDTYTSLNLPELEAFRQPPD